MSPFDIAAGNPSFPKPGNRTTKYLVLVATVFASIGAVAAHADPESATNQLMGAWARNMKGCGRPEFIFKPQLAVIQGDADGTPVRFEYPSINDSIAGNTVSVDVRKKHPIGGTASDSILTFHLIDNSHIEIVRKRMAISLERCASDSGA